MRHLHFFSSRRLVRAWAPDWRGAITVLAVALGLMFTTMPAAHAQLRAFTLPWDDGSATITDLSALNRAPITSEDRLTADAAGHIVAGTRRERILGVNITASGAFPPKDKADAIAARMAKFGINGVRFHHLEAPWEPRSVLLDYLVNSSGAPIGRSRQLNAERLDRLHYFIARLKAHGIYSNLNLLVSRQFFADDGLPAAIEQLGWKNQHQVGFFDPQLLALQQEHATNLLTSLNPYTGLTLAADPAVAFVEINNENGLLQAWHDQVLDTLPAVYATSLRTQWNAWLAARYPSTAALLTAWGARDEPLGPNRLLNGTFASGTTSWGTEAQQGAAATFTQTSDFTGGQPALRIQISTAGTAGWHVQLNQSGHQLTVGEIYTVSFWARSSTAGRAMTADFTRSGPSDYSSVASLFSLSLGTAWTEYTTSFIAGTTEPAVRLNFSGLGNATGSVWLADVRFSTGGQAGALPPGTSLEAGTVPTVGRLASGILPLQRRDWVAFLLATERTYWRAMRDHVKDTLAYPGLVFGTIGSNSPAGVQAETFDVVDSHAYWSHPEFPGGSWDAVNWTVANTSLANTLDTTFGDLARQRVRGKPFFCTEYQHSQPNSYGAEGPLLAAAYGALQDWDGFWIFQYGTSTDGWARGHVDEFFAIDTHPTKMANLLLAAAIFRRGDVAAARHEIALRFDDETQLDVTSESGGAWSVGDARHLGLSGRHALVNRIALVTGATVTSGRLDPPAAPTATTLVSDTGELTWSLAQAGAGIITVDTARSKALVGFPAARTFDLGGFVFAPGTTRLGWLTAGLTLVEGTSLTHAGGGRALLVVTGEMENTGQLWKDSTNRSVGSNWGRAPTLVEVVPLTLTLPQPAARVTAWALDVTGARAGALTVTADAQGRARLALGTSGDTLWYEVVIAPDPVGVAPTFTRQLLGATVAAGEPVTLRVEVEGAPAPTFTWHRDGAPLPGVTGAELFIPAASANDAGSYTVTATNSAGSLTSRAAQLALRTPEERATLRLVNLSTRGRALTGNSVLIPGFVISGTGSRQLLVRAVGPALEGALAGYHPDPRFDVMRSRPGEPAEFLLAADDWTPAGAGTAFMSDLAAGSKDAATRATLASGLYSAVISGNAGATGIVVAELYDLGQDAAGEARIVNLSTRGEVGTGNDLLIAGFAISGDAPKRLLLRAVGPGLAEALDGYLEDPQLQIIQMRGADPGIPLATNDDWWTDPRNRAEVAAATFTDALRPGSKDAAMVVELEPGNYTVLVSGVRADTGIAIVEVYEWP